MLLQKIDSLPLLRAGSLNKQRLHPLANVSKKKHNSSCSNYTSDNKSRSGSFYTNELLWKARKRSNTEWLRRSSGIRMREKISICWREVGPKRRKFSINLLKCGAKIDPGKSAFSECKNRLMIAETLRLQLKNIVFTGQFGNKTDKNAMVRNYFEMMCSLVSLPLDSSDICIHGLETLGDIFALCRNCRSALIYYYHAVTALRHA